jgi:hypothetical protein
VTIVNETTAQIVAQFDKEKGKRISYRVDGVHLIAYEEEFKQVHIKNLF